ncbi:Endochitinase A1 like protein [Verticillium longisporum]|uniref:chitinase n=1 Tax=Verticillium longisporum TaxID=100787 RepID=A0A8I3AM65_VERLO|nr:Endochitinase A1 like protein [Verticillium longisporum]
MLTTFLKAVIAVAVIASPVLAKTSGGLNIYWGQFGDQTDRLASYCDVTGVTSVTLSFVNKSPRYGNGYPGINFAGHCGAHCGDEEFYVYPANGGNTALIMNCDTIKQDIRYCQSKGKRIILSVGGHCKSAPCGYDVLEEDEAEAFAKQLHSIFGPYDPGFDGPRPFDIDENGRVAVDGLDFDIEFKYDNQAPYIRMVDVLRTLNPSYYISVAPQCPTGDGYFQLKELVYGARFDAFFVQFYNNPGCQASDNITSLYETWSTVLSETRYNGEAELFVGVLSDPLAGGSGYVDYAALRYMVCQLRDKRRFGGLSVWDATRGSSNSDIDGNNFNDYAARALEFDCDSVAAPTPTFTSRLTSAAAVTSSVELVTSTMFATILHTTTSCGPEHCETQVFAETMPLYTAVCPGKNGIFFHLPSRASDALGAGEAAQATPAVTPVISDLAVDKQNAPPIQTSTSDAGAKRVDIISVMTVSMMVAGLLL